MHYLLIEGPSYRGLDFERRERIREEIRTRLESHGIRFLEYNWVWDEEDRCLLLVGQYERMEDAYWWTKALEAMDFKVVAREALPGED